MGKLHLSRTSSQHLTKSAITLGTILQTEAHTIHVRNCVFQLSASSPSASSPSQTTYSTPPSSQHKLRYNGELPRQYLRYRSRQSQLLLLLQDWRMPTR